MKSVFKKKFCIGLKDTKIDCWFWVRGNLKVNPFLQKSVLVMWNGNPAEFCIPGKAFEWNQDLYFPLDGFSDRSYVTVLGNFEWTLSSLELCNTYFSSLVVIARFMFNKILLYNWGCYICRNSTLLWRYSIFSSLQFLFWRQLPKSLRSDYFDI